MTIDYQADRERHLRTLIATAEHAIARGIPIPRAGLRIAQANLKRLREGQNLAEAAKAAAETATVDYTHLNQLEDQK